MAERIPARLTVAQGRRFGLTVGGAFLFIAGVLWWRDRDLAFRVVGAVGSLLALGGLLVPTHLGPVERAWMKLALAISKVTTPIIMGIMYLAVLTPVGAVRRLLGGNPLVHEPVERSYWRSRPKGSRRSGSLQRQF
jgi:hypothetical protein